MVNQAKNNEKVISELFESTFFSGFSFDCNFTLKFSRNKVLYYEGKKLPQHFILTILTDWWFDLKKDWMGKVESLNNYNAIEPEEPVQAFELAILRWSDGAEVKEVKFNEECMTLIFKNKKALSILCESDEDYAWIIEENKFPANDSKWSAVCEDRKVYVEIKED